MLKIITKTQVILEYPTGMGGEELQEALKTAVEEWHLNNPNSTEHPKIVLRAHAEAS